MNIILMIGIGLGILATCIDIIGTAIPFWWVPKGSNINFGLFRVCTDSVCLDIETIFKLDWWRATQAMVLLSIIAMGVGVVLAILFGVILRDKQILLLAAAFMTFCGAVFAAIGVIIFGAKTRELGLEKSLHAGFGLVVIAAVIAIPAAVMMLLSRTRTGYQPK